MITTLVVVVVVVVVVEVSNSHDTNDNTTNDYNARAGLVEVRTLRCVGIVQ